MKSLEVFLVAVIGVLSLLCIFLNEVNSQRVPSKNYYRRPAIAPQRTSTRQQYGSVRRTVRAPQTVAIRQAPRQNAVARQPQQQIRTVRQSHQPSPVIRQPQQQQHRAVRQHFPQQRSGGIVAPTNQQHVQYYPKFGGATSAAGVGGASASAGFGGASASAGFGGASASAGFGGAASSAGFGFNPYTRGPYGHFGGGRYGPRRPHPHRYRDFARVFHEIDRKADPKGHNAAAENDDINDDFNGRSVVAPGQYPHMAALGFRSTTREIEFKCGGSLISEFFVVTAAHCCYINGQAPRVVKIGDIKLKERERNNLPQRRRVAQIFLHPYYNSTLYYNDIALILLDNPIEHTPFVRPIRLWAQEEIPYEKVYTMGYGSTSFATAPTNILTELDLSIVPWGTCNSTLPPEDSTPFGILESQICAKDYEKNRDTCQGDSGGPLQLNLERRRPGRRPRYYLVGITSYGTICRSQYPGVYTRVSSYIDWIASVVWPGYFEGL